MRHKIFLLLDRVRAVQHDERGAVSIEMALVTLVVSGLLFGVVEIARYGLLRYYLELSTYHAARFLTLNPNEMDAAQDMVRAEVERGVGSSLSEVHLYIKSTRENGRCMLVVDTQVHYTSMALSWLFTDPRAESVQVWPQADDCGVVTAPPLLPTRTPTPRPTLIPIPSVPLDQSQGVAMVNANIRLGPGFEYAIVGRLDAKEAVQVRGRDTTATWLEIVPERIGWVYAPLIQLNVPVSDLKIVDAPPHPVRTAVPPPRLRFDSVSRVLKVGECTLLSWDAGGANFVTLNEENVRVHGEQRVCPTQDTTYVLSAGYDQDRFYDREVRVLIYPMSDP